MTTSTGTSNWTKADRVPALRNLEPIRVVPGGRLWVHGEGWSAQDDGAYLARLIETPDDDMIAAAASATGPVPPQA